MLFRLPLRSSVIAVVLSLAASAPASADVVTAWNATALSCIGTGRPGPTGLVDLALVHGAMHDAVQRSRGASSRIATARRCFGASEIRKQPRRPPPLTHWWACMART